MKFGKFVYDHKFNVGTGLLYWHVCLAWRFSTYLKLKP